MLWVELAQTTEAGRKEQGSALDEKAKVKRYTSAESVDRQDASDRAENTDRLNDPRQPCCLFSRKASRLE